MDTRRGPKKSRRERGPCRPVPRRPPTKIPLTREEGPSRREERKEDPHRERPKVEETRTAEVTRSYSVPRSKNRRGGSRRGFIWTTRREEGTTGTTATGERLLDGRRGGCVRDSTEKTHRQGQERRKRTGPGRRNPRHMGGVDVTGVGDDTGETVRDV